MASKAKQSLHCYNACFPVVINLLKFTVPAVPVSCSCPAGSSMGYCPDPDDCERYIQCDGAVEYIQKCGNGTIWYQNLLTCGHGYKVFNCKR